MSLNLALGKKGEGHRAFFPTNDKDANGKVVEIELQFMPISQKNKATYSEWLKKRARRASRDTIAELREEAAILRKMVAKGVDEDGNPFTEEEKTKLSMKAFGFERDASTHHKELDAAITAGDYEFASDVSIESMSSMDGMAMLAHLCLKDKQPSITMEDCTELVKENFRDVSRAIRRANGLETEEVPQKAETAQSPPENTSVPTTSTES